MQMKRLLVLLTFFASATGCSSRLLEKALSDTGDYQFLYGGSIVKCTEGRAHFCGAYLWHCDDGNEYYCVTNIKELKK